MMGAPINNTATESSQATYLSAVLMNSGIQIADGIANGNAGHAEDILIDNILPANVHNLAAPPALNWIEIGINRSPCSSTPLNGHTSCNKGNARLGCAERLLSLVLDGLSINGVTYFFKIGVQYRNIYGSTAQEQACSLAAVNLSNQIPNIAYAQQRIANSEQFMGTKAAIIASQYDR
jgi:hypothetical protein